jgi:hypothetical protein
MTANWAATVVNVLILAFFALAAIGIGLGIYAAKALKKAEERAGGSTETTSVEAPVAEAAVAEAPVEF